MKHLLKISALALFVAVGAFAFTSLTPSTTVAHEGEDHSEEVAQAENNEGSEAEAKSPYSYTTQSGDSYTKIARKAVQTYGVNNNVNLSGAQIVAAETFLTNEAGSPSLTTGQEVSISEASVKAAVEKAQGLDETTLARWEKYVKYVNFDTNNVGESRQ